MAMGKLQGKVAVVTGATEGIGLATAQLFVKEGAYVFITGRRQKELDEAVTAIGSNATGIEVDSLVGSNQKGDKYGNETKEKREQRAPSDRNLRRRRESSGRRGKLGA